MKIRNIKSVKHLRRTLSFCRSMGITKAVDVPIRKRGMTGSGMLGECHSNVRLLTKTYGGRKVLGFAVAKNDSNMTVPKRIPFCDESVFFLHHSVWETPEGEMVDVTCNNLPVESIVFLPLKKYDPRVEEYGPPGNVCFTPNDGIWLFGIQELKGDAMHFSNKDIKINSKTMRNYILESDDTWEDENETGGFTKPSTATGLRCISMLRHFDGSNAGSTNLSF